MTTELISKDARKQIDIWVQKYPKDQQQSAVLAALRVVQEENGGWLTTAHLNAVAEYLNMPNITVYEVATFYTMFNLKPVGKYRIGVCRTLSCALCGSDDIAAHLKKRLDVEFGETTPDGKFTLQALECLAYCQKAPVIQINDREHRFNMTAEKVDALLEELE